MVARPETRYRQKVRGLWPHWSCGYEPGFGSNDGYPDIQVLCPFTFKLVPIELKVGSFKRNDPHIYVKEVRPSQVVWHHKFWKAHGRSAIMIGMEDLKGQWFSYAFSAEDLTGWREGFHPANAIASFSQKNMERGIQEICDWCISRGPKENGMVRSADISQEGIRGPGVSIL
jgi:hypothetical protein